MSKKDLTIAGSFFLGLGAIMLIRANKGASITKVLSFAKLLSPIV